jgi:hypothetical protein
MPMGETWKERDLGGGGLQQANLRLARLLRRRAVVCALLAAFPLGLHRDYLRDRRGAWLFRLGTVACLVAVAANALVFAGLIALGIIAAAAIDLARIDALVAAVNKRLRMEVYLGTTAGAPPGFRGHYTDDAPAATARNEAPEGERPASFAEQEELLRQIARSRRNDA